MFGVSVCARKRLKRSRRSRSWQKRKPRSKRRALERQSWLKGTARCRRNTMTDPVIHQLRRQTNKTASVGQTRSVRGGLIVLAVIAGFALGLLVFTIGPKLANSWQESRWHRQAEANLKQGNFNGANDAAQQALQINHDSLPAYQILAEATEKQNRAETVVWRAEIARWRPRRAMKQARSAISPQLWQRNRATKPINTTSPRFGSNRPIRRKTRGHAQPSST